MRTFGLDPHVATTIALTEALKHARKNADAALIKKIQAELEQHMQGARS